MSCLLLLANNFAFYTSSDLTQAKQSTALHNAAAGCQLFSNMHYPKTVACCDSHTTCYCFNYELRADKTDHHCLNQTLTN